MTQFINLQPSAVKIRALAAKGLLIAGVTGTHQPHRPRAGRDAQERWGGGVFQQQGEVCTQTSPLPRVPRSLAPQGLAAPPSRHDPPGEHRTPGVAPLPPPHAGAGWGGAVGMGAQQKMCGAGRGGLVWGERRDGAGRRCVGTGWGL